MKEADNGDKYTHHTQSNTQFAIFVATKREMEKYFGRAYRGDPGIPHSKPGAFSNIWFGTAIFMAQTINSPYWWQVTNEVNFHDLAMLHEQYHARKALEKNKRYKSLWNSHEKEWLDSYYEYWTTYFP